ncbi:N-acetylmuramoyl-L-alanine amidase [Heyndrickxia sporothermodurans]|uniref:N-acetylmuramoyl-L-alanine amidase n=1 Tax=Heyndrickxia sporothermodurans TaxID=46224 RepID=A0A150KST8_9BACI|nr:N-acetylmuramoyl-L-alanine amidase [Heyndrickxia sporothermodurans]KYD02621.1 N-acetylmuramoyl-L-alanine amidase [Heyndrickxia sporothermodurans]
MKIAIDAGHGYNTAGKRVPDGSMREWEFNNATALKVRDLLKDYENVEVLLTHDTTGKTDVPLTTRTNKANNWKADVLVSIHANALDDKWSSAHGIETWIYTSIKNGSETYKLAENLQSALIKETGLANRGVKKGDLHMVRETHMPAALVECGFMSNKDEAKLLKSDAYRQKCAQAIVEGLVKQYKLKKKAVKKEEPKKETPMKATPKKDGKLSKVQVGAFSDPKNAEKLAAELKKKGYKPFITKQ